ncbi:hypothetical protein NC652_033872 [Populus alba x Populus x berolinensis]|nr:hypothetical protein NC652_036245 [Populus alba x Populus x berolinensis]KAJ6880668.1 hypothetical protein NC652_033872 [Populus alba x Populus x berolinensis]
MENLLQLCGRAHQLRGARRFSFDEITKSTNNFSEANHIGSGGYRMISLSLFSYPAMVYRRMLPTGQLIAIKRCRQGAKVGWNSTWRWKFYREFIIKIKNVVI